MKITDKLQELGVEITPEIEKALGGDYITKQEHEKKLEKITIERDQLRADYDAAKTTLEGFEGKDFDALTADVEKWKKEAETAKKDYEAKLSARDYSDAIKTLTQDIKFSSSSAKKAFMADLESNPLQMREGKVLGFDDYLKNYKEQDADAFIKDEAATRAQFTSPIHTQTGGNNGTDLAQLRSVMGLSNDKK